MLLWFEFSGSQLGAIPPPPCRGHQAVSGDKFACHHWEGAATGSGEWRPGVPLNILQCTGARPTTAQNHPAPNIIGAEVERLIQFMQGAWSPGGHTYTPV